MIKVGDKVHRIGTDVIFIISDVTAFYDSDLKHRTIVKVKGWDSWYIFDGMFVEIPQTRKYRVYKEVEASSADEARRLLGESFSVEEVK